MNNADGSSWPYAGVDGAAAAAWNDVQRNGNMVSSIRTSQGRNKRAYSEDFDQLVHSYIVLPLKLLSWPSKASNLAKISP